MSVTMLLRRSPELDVASLSRLNLISSNTLSPSATPPSRSGSPNLIMSNNTLSVHNEHVTVKMPHKGRDAVVPQTLRLRELHLGGNAEAAVDSGGNGAEAVRKTVHGSQLWDVIQHGSFNGHSTTKRAQQADMQHTQHSMADAEQSAPVRSAKNKAFTTTDTQCSVINSSANSASEEHPYDLYHHSQKLTMQLAAGFRGHTVHGVPADPSPPAANGQLSVAEHADMNVTHAEAVTSAAAKCVANLQLVGEVDKDLGGQSVSRSESPDAGRLPPTGSCSMQLPGLDSYEGGTAAAEAVEVQRSYSIQSPAAGTHLMRRVSSVRFLSDLVDSPDDGTDDASSQNTSPSAALIHNTDRASADGSAVADSPLQPSTSLSDQDPTCCVHRTVSSVSTASSLKSALKQTLSRVSSVATPSRGGGSLLGSVSGVSFAVGHEEAEEAEGSAFGQSSALMKQGSESFPSWLTDKYALSHMCT